MDPSSEPDRAAVFDFVSDFLDDLERGAVRELVVYLRRYPGHEEAIAGEYLRLRAEESASETEVAAQAGSGSEGPGGPERVGPYRLLEELGAGGQATVWLAEDSRIERKVALKLLRVGFLMEEPRRRFRREAEIIARLEHPGICGIHEADIDGDTPYIAMRFVDGVVMGNGLESAKVAHDVPDVSASATASEYRALPWLPRSRAELHRMLHLFERTARALHAAHEAGVTHRDIKPGNIAITSAGDPVILDFGLAQDERSQGEHLTRSGDVFGTPAYMSPEQLRGTHDALDARTDVYSLGVTLFEALTLTRPFEGKGRLELERAILYQPVPDPRAVNPHLSEDVKVILETALDKDRERRYASALELAEDLRRVREFEPIRARPAGPILRLSRWARRQPVVATALSVTLIALTTGLLVALKILDQKQAALDRAEGRLLAKRSEELVDENPATALALAIDAVKLAPSYRTRSALFAPLDACHLESVLEVENVHRFWDLRMSPDGVHVAGALDDGTARVWEIVTGTEVVVLQCADAGTVRRIAYDPSGKRIATATLAGTLQVWDARTGAELERIGVAGGALLWTEFSPDGALLVVLPADEPARVWSTATWEVIAELDVDARTAGSARFSADSSRLLTASLALQGEPETRSHVASLWDPRTGAKLAELRGHTGVITWSEFNADGTRIATASEDGTARLWDGASGAPIGDPFEHADVVTCATQSSDGLRLATTMGGREASGAFLWDLATGTRTELSGHKDARIVHAAFDASGARVATSSYDLSVRVWDAASGRLIRSFKEHPQQVKALWTSDGRRVVTQSVSAMAHVWRVGNMPYAYPLGERGAAVTTASFLQDGERAITGSADGILRLWHTPVGGEEGALEPGALLYEVVAHDGGISGAELCGDGTVLLTWSEDKTAKLWDPKTGACLADALLHSGPVTDADLRADGACVVSVEESGAAWLWSTERRWEGVPLEEHEQPVRRARFSESGKWLATAGEDDAVWIRDGEQGTPLVRIEFSPRSGQGGVNDFAFRPGGGEIALACADGYLRVFDPATGAPTRPERRGFKSRTLQYLPGGQRLLMRGFLGGGAIVLRDYAEGRDVRPGTWHSGHMTSHDVSPDGLFVLTGSQDATAYVWRAHGGEIVAHWNSGGSAVLAIGFSPVSGDHRVLAGCEDGSASIWPVDPLPAALARKPRELYAWERDQDE